MESGADNSPEQDISTVTNELEETTAKRNKTLWQKEENWKITKKPMERWSNPTVNGVCNVDCLELGKDPVTHKTVTQCLQRIGCKPITYCNDPLPPK